MPAPSCPVWSCLVCARSVLSCLVYVCSILSYLVPSGLFPVLSGLCPLRPVLSGPAWSTPTPSCNSPCLKDSPSHSSTRNIPTE
ncbi:hypothetical protein XENTR_v10015200 [Xenopus tropicalis]|nr:hypothetical protein XENTR_v10015200 [Xenopus tropicalis]